MNNILARWNALSIRERVLLSLLIIMIAGYFIFNFIWRPVDAAVSRRVQNVQERIDLYSALEPRIEEAKLGLKDNSANKNITTFSGNAMVTVEDTIKEHELSKNLSLASPSGDSISVWFTNIAFNDWLEWVETMRDKGVIVTQAKVSAEKDRPGIVNVKSLVTPVQ